MRATTISVIFPWVPGGRRGRDWGLLPIIWLVESAPHSLWGGLREDLLCEVAGIAARPFGGAPYSIGFTAAGAWKSGFCCPAGLVLILPVLAALGESSLVVFVRWLHGRNVYLFIHGLCVLVKILNDERRARGRCDRRPLHWPDGFGQGGEALQYRGR